MNKFIFTFFLALICSVGFAQITNPDSLKQALKIATTDSARHNACVELYFYYVEVNRDSALLYAEKRLELAKQNNNKLAEAFALTSKSYQYTNMGKFAASYQNLLLALRIAEDPNSKEKNGWRLAQFPIPGKGRLILLSNVHQFLGTLMRSTENPKQEVLQFKEALRIARQVNHIDRQRSANMTLAGAYLRMNQLDSALYYAKEADFFSKNPAYKSVYKSSIIAIIGDIYLQKGDKQQAKKYYYEGLLLANENNNQSSIAQINRNLIQVFLQENEKDSALVYAVKNLGIVKSLRSETVAINTGTAYEDVYLAYKLNNQVDSAYKYQGLALVAKDSFYRTRIKNIADFQSLSLEETKRLENLEKDAIQTQSKIRTYSLLLMLAVFSIIGFILYRNNRQKQKANIILENTLSTLKSTQAQLIQSEKLASLGELTAGIAHEIQNPLNFVNNFSEVSSELVTEMKEEMAVGNQQSANEIADDLKQNLEKITLHGKRASSIVKGMLEHSKASSGEKELTDVNALADEYLRLAYHGLRAKESTFNSDFKTDFDSNLPKINVLPQDIGRVLLNLINNAFYAVKEVEKPLVSVSTEHIDNLIVIKIKDNGTGMSKEVQSKIFQPFFTTKPTCQGTGLGLSLAYDIVTKGHGGALEVVSTEGEGSEFIIKLPL